MTQIVSDIQGYYRYSDIKEIFPVTNLDLLGKKKNRFRWVKLWGDWTVARVTVTKQATMFMIIGDETWYSSDDFDGGELIWGEWLEEPAN